MRERRFVNTICRIAGFIMLLMAEPYIHQMASIWYGVAFLVGGCALLIFGYRDKIFKKKDTFY